MSQKTKGISLIVLVITIIIIIILAGAVILSLNNSNIIAKAKVAKESNDFTGIREAVEMEKSNKQLNSASFDKTKVTIPDSYSNDIEVTAEGTILLKYNATSKITDITNAIQKLGAVYIPNGFIASNVNGENSKEEGLVIYDNTPVLGVAPGEASTDIDAQTTRNQFVWVPVENYNDFIIRQNFNTNQTVSFGILAKEASKYFEMPTVSNYTGSNVSQLEVNAMYASVQKYHGFYIARYEASNNGSGVVESKKQKTGWSDIPWGGLNTDVATDGAAGNDADSAGAVYKARAIYTSGANPSGYPVSTLVYGVEWDALMRWYKLSGIDVSNSGTWGNYGNSTGGAATGSGVVRTTGYNEYWKAKNVYDIAGNLREWTMEGYSTGSRTMRGGHYTYFSVNGPAAYRASTNPQFASDGTVGFRVALYIK